MKYTCTDCGGEQEGVEGALLSKGWVLLSGSPLCPVCVKLRRCLDRIAEENVILKDMERSEGMSWKNCGCNVGEACDHAGEKDIKGNECVYSACHFPHGECKGFCQTTAVDKSVMGGPAVEGLKPGTVYYTPASALSIQVGGGHYKDMKIQPVEYIHQNGIGFAEGCVIKYVSRWRAKGGVEDLKKARHFLDLLIEMEGGSP